MKFSAKRILISEFSFYWLILLYLQFRWLPKERNTVYTGRNVGINTRQLTLCCKFAMALSTEGIMLRRSASAAVVRPSE